MEKALDKLMSGITRAEYIEVESNVRLHITDGGEGRPVVLVHGWPAFRLPAGRQGRPDSYREGRGAYDIFNTSNLI